jgi:hypothetical protein
MLSFAIPSLEKQITPLHGNVDGKIPASKYFKNTNMTSEELQRRIALAGDSIGKELLLTTFSFFEAYVASAVQEILEFHGGVEKIATVFKSTVRHADEHIPANIKKSKRKLQEYPKANLLPKYQKHQRVLHDFGYPLPSQRASAFGWLMLSKVLENMKAVKIPEILQDALLFPITTAETGKFHNLRGIRNDIAHGTLTKYPVRTAIEHGAFFRNLAVNIDEHIVENFFVIEK